jgi:hypothetical protein
MNTMKITKRQLKRIIKEEKAKLLRERSPRPAVDWDDEGTPEVEDFSEDAAKQLEALIDDLVAEAEAIGGEHARKKVFKRIADATANMRTHPNFVEWRYEG